jgi:hypothetical protein
MPAASATASGQAPAATITLTQPIPSPLDGERTAADPPVRPRRVPRAPHEKPRLGCQQAAAGRRSCRGWTPARSPAVPGPGQPAGDLEAVKVGSWMSSTTTFGRRRPTASMGNSASAASPTTLKPSSCSRARAIAREGAWSATNGHRRSARSCHRLMVARTQRASHRGCPWFRLLADRGKRSATAVRPRTPPKSAANQRTYWSEDGSPRKTFQLRRPLPKRLSALFPPAAVGGAGLNSVSAGQRLICGRDRV